jgi:signal transduction histidine kinase
VLVGTAATGCAFDWDGHTVSRHCRSRQRALPIAKPADGVGELRDLAHGVYPAILTQHGLAAALDDLAARTAIPVSVHAPRERLPEDVEAVAYFVACESLANAVKHAAASEVSIEAAVDAGRLLVTVKDNGSGGADVNGSGLRGLADRLEARGGCLRIVSPPGGGTRLTAEIPYVA